MGVTPPAEATPCSVCGSTEGRPGGWSHAQTFTFDGRVHSSCLDSYSDMKPLLWSMYHNKNGTRRADGAVGGFSGVLEGLGVPKVGRDWDKTHPGYHAWLHGVRNAGKLFEMMNHTRRQ